MMRNLVLLVISFFIVSGVQAQLEVSGQVTDRLTGGPIEYATVELRHLADSSTKLTATDKKGRFRFEAVGTGKYLLRYSFIGYQTATDTIDVPLAGRPMDYGVKQLERAGNKLEEVTVVGRRAMQTNGIDRKIYNVDQDIMSRSGAAADILRNIPSVEVDLDGNVSLRGSGDVTILINGKPSPLMGRSRADVLQQLPANSIERIEVITNPSARYRPDGTGGVINIVLKKNIKNGFNGSATANAGNRNRYNGNLTLNYRPGKWNLFTSYGMRQDSRRRKNFIDRTDIDDNGTQIHFLQSNYSQTRPFVHNFNAGFDYNINDHNSTGASVSFFSRKQTRTDQTNNQTLSASGVILESFDRYRFDPEHQKQHSATAYFQHQFAKEDHELRIEWNTSREEEVENNAYTNVYHVPARPNSFDNTRIAPNTKENQLTADLSLALSETSRLEAGYDGLFTREDLDFRGEYFDAATQSFKTDGVKTNRFIYNGNIHALYGTWQQAYEKFSFEAGLRMEGAFTSGHLITIDSTVGNDYYKLYPTVHLAWKLKEQSELQLNYSKRVNRPEADELNPFPEYQDPRNVRSGNPNLLPEIIHSTEFGFKWQHKGLSFVPSIYYRYKQNGFTSVVQKLNDTLLLTTNENLANDQSAGLELIFGAKAGSWFSSSLSTNIFYNRINASNLGYLQNRSIYSMSVNLYSSFSLTSTTMLSLSTNYRSARLTPQGKSYPSIVLNTGLRQELFHNKVSVTLTASDLFNSLRQKTRLDLGDLQQVSLGRRDGRIIYLGLAYRFGIVKKPKDEKLQFDNNL